MEMVVDASAYLAVVLQEPERQRIIELTKGVELISPEILPYEIGNALIAMYKRKRIEKEQVAHYFKVFDVIPFQAITVDILKSLGISCHFNCYAYDSYYLEIAHKLKLPLLTLDNEMKQNAQLLNIKIIEL